MLRVYLIIQYAQKFEQANSNAVCLSRPLFNHTSSWNTGICWMA